MRRLLLAAVLAGLVFGCAPTPSSPWRMIELDGLSASALVTAGSEVFVSGSQQDHPALIRIVPERRTFTLIPNEPYAVSADLVAVALAADQAIGIGTDIGGAHSNPRWTVWEGSAKDASLVDRPQEFFTFGGHDAGPLLGAAIVDGHRVIVGTRTSSAGGRVVLYTPTGTRWHGSDSSPAELTSDTTRMVSPTAMTTTTDQLVLVGDVVTLRPQLQQAPALWVGWGTHWTLVELPVPAEATGSGLRRATSVACTASGTCWVAGWAGGHPLVWQVPLSDPSAATATVLPGTAPADTDPTPVVGLVADRVTVATNATDASIQWQCRDQWRSGPAPGSVSQLAGSGGVVYAISDGRVWAADPQQC